MKARQISSELCRCKSKVGLKGDLRAGACVYPSLQFAENLNTGTHRRSAPCNRYLVSLTFLVLRRTAVGYEKITRSQHLYTSVTGSLFFIFQPVSLNQRVECSIVSSALASAKSYGAVYAARKAWAAHRNVTHQP